MSTSLSTIITIIQTINLIKATTAMALSIPLDGHHLSVRKVLLLPQLHR